MNILDYSRGPKAKTWSRRCLRTAVLLVLAVAAVVSFRRVQPRLQNMLLERRCLRHVADDSVVVSIIGREKPGPAASDYATLFSKGMEVPSVYVRRESLNDWAAFQRALGLQPDDCRGSLFLGELRSPRGNRRLVAVGVEQGMLEPRMTATVVSPGGLTKNSVLEWADRPIEYDGPAEHFMLLFYVYPDGKLYRARADPADPSRLLMRFEHRGRSGSLVFRLTDDDRIRVSIE